VLIDILEEVKSVLIVVFDRLIDVTDEFGHDLRVTGGIDGR